MSTFRSSTSTVFDKSRIADQIFKDLRNNIVLGNLPSGTKLPPERELVQRYGVSGPTVREAIRGLALLGLVDVRHGSGTYVTADTGGLVATSLSAVIQMGKPEVADVLGILGVLTEYAASQAARAATKEDHARIRSAMNALDDANSAETVSEAARDFHRSIAMATHNPLLVALCSFLTDIQIELGHELIGDSESLWQKLLAKLQSARTALVEAIMHRDNDGAVNAAREFQTKALQFITSLPKAKEARITDPQLRDLLLSMMARVG